MADFSAIAKWPNVPACYEWLSLDRRGDWRLQGERVTHRGLIDFLNKQYASDESGRWFVQNGPQRVFVALACTPWVFRKQEHRFIAHTGEPNSFLDPLQDLVRRRQGLRDILANEVPFVMGPDDLYAIPAMLGAITYAVVDYLGPQWVAVLVGSVLATVLRLMAMIFHWRLPTGPRELIT